MPNIATALKDEVSRLARKELRNQTDGMKKTSAQHRRDIAALKRQVAALERQVAALAKQAPKAATESPAAEGHVSVRFTAKGLRSQRARLGFSAPEYAKLVGVTSQSIYNWESGTASPRKEQVAALANLRSVGKKEARARLAQLSGK